MVVVIQFKKNIISVYVICVIICKLIYWQVFYQVILRKVDKSPKIGFYYAILMFDLAIGL